MALLMSAEKVEFVTFPDTALKIFTHCAAAAAALSRANRLAKVVLHVSKMSHVVKETVAHARQKTRRVPADVSLLPLIFLSPREASASREIEYKS